MIENKGGASGIPGGAGLRAGGARRLHALPRLSQHAVDQSADVQQAAVRRGQGLHAHHQPLPPGRGAVRVSSLNVNTRRRAQGLCPGASAHAELRHARTRLQSRDVPQVDEPAVERQHRRHPLPRRRADRASAGRRRTADRQDGAGQLPRAARDRQDQAARGRRRAALEARAGRPDARRGRHRLSAVRLVGPCRRPRGFRSRSSTRSTPSS